MDDKHHREEKLYGNGNWKLMLLTFIILGIIYFIFNQVISIFIYIFVKEILKLKNYDY